MGPIRARKKFYSILGLTTGIIGLSLFVQMWAENGLKTTFLLELFRYPFPVIPLITFLGALSLLIAPLGPERSHAFGLLVFLGSLLSILEIIVYRLGG